MPLPPRPDIEVLLLPVEPRNPDVFWPPPHPPQAQHHLHCLLFVVCGAGEGGVLPVEVPVAVPGHQAHPGPRERPHQLPNLGHLNRPPLPICHAPQRRIHQQPAGVEGPLCAAVLLLVRRRELRQLHRRLEVLLRPQRVLHGQSLQRFFVPVCVLHRVVLHERDAEAAGGAVGGDLPQGQRRQRLHLPPQKKTKATSPTPSSSVSCRC